MSSRHLCVEVLIKPLTYVFFRFDHHDNGIRDGDHPGCPGSGRDTRLGVSGPLPQPLHGAFFHGHLHQLSEHRLLRQHRSIRNFVPHSTDPLLQRLW